MQTYFFYFTGRKTKWNGYILASRGAMEVLWSTFLKFSEGFTKPLPTVITAAGLAASMFFFREGDKGAAYRHGLRHMESIGALGAVIVGIVVC